MKIHTYRKYLEFIGLCLLAGVLFWWFGRKLNWAEVRAAVSHSNPYLLLAAASIVSLSYVVRAFRWGALLRPLVSSRFRDLFAATTVGFGTVFLIGRAGEVVRPVVLPMRDERVRPSAAIVTIMVERIYDMMAVVLMFAINLVWFKAPPSLQKDFTKVRAVGLGLLVGTMIGIVLLTWFRKNSTFVIAGFTKVFDRLDFIPGRISKLAISILEQLARALRVLVNLKELAETITWTAVLWLGVALANLLIIRAFGVTFGFSETIFVMGWSLAGSLVPTPGGAAGAFHAATAAGLIFLGVAPETAAGISIVMHVIDFGPALLFGFFYIIRGDLSFSKLRALASPEAVEHVVEDEDLLPDNANTKHQTLGGVLTD
ncbi:MAG TPA: lysylphosphatidylglycerol synthase transmembrane domain-containing protein [Pyrinomonadaceae bacterium]|nr:lysylphosphatidylglycerol synthase transmembrane domain-containing protein [Pyrinomonadaceae bacterium]